MKVRNVFCCLMLLWFGVVNLYSQVLSSEQMLNDNWTFKHEGKWLQAEVPGNNYADLLSHGIIEDPFVGTNEEKVQWVKNLEWEYQTEFIPTEDLFSQEKKELIFEGLDSYAEVFLNDKKILSANNQFRTWTIDVSKLLQKGKNKLSITFLPPLDIEKKKIKEQGYELPGGTRTMTRKAGFHYGWDWGAKITTAGIWRNVKLKGWSALKITNIYIEQRKTDENLSNLRAYFTYENYKKGTYEFFTDEGGREIIELEEGTGEVYVPFTISKPNFWWPNGQGEPFLYSVDLGISLDGKKIFSEHKKIGIRKVELITDKDEKGREFYFKINGRPIFMKGANYIPQDNLQNRVTPQDYRNLLQDVVDANMNMIRVWGGGIYEEDIFYDLCDSLGILVWQDFMFACAMYPGDKEYLENVKQEAQENVLRLRNHPSIVLWCGNNENSEGWHRWGWQDAFSMRERRKIWKAYKKVFNKMLPETVEMYTELPYWESSPQFGRGNPRHQFEGDAHYWGVWHDAEPFEVLAEKVPRFMSEFGFQSFPQISTTRAFAKEKDLNLESDVMNTHQKHPRGNALINEYMARDYKVPTDFEDFVYVSQVLQAEGMRFGLEAQRRNQPYCMGTLYWQLNDCWPVASWSSRDYYGNWKALHYAAKETFAPLAISFDTDSLNVNIAIVSDLQQEIKDVLAVQIIDFHGNELWSKEFQTTIQANTSQVFANINIAEIEEIDIHKVVLVAQLKAEKIKHLLYFSKTKTLQLPKENIELNIQKIAEGFQVELFSKQLMKNVYLEGIQGKYSDNYFTLLPQEKKVITIKTQEENSDLLHIKSMNKIHEKY